jgi:hypothetical protein
MQGEFWTKLSSKKGECSNKCADRKNVICASLLMNQTSLIEEFRDLSIRLCLKLAEKSIILEMIKIMSNMLE